MVTVGSRGGAVRLARLEKRFGDTWAVRPLDLEVGDGELVVLVGPSGCGKTTVLRMIAGLEEPTGGTIHIGGCDVADVEPAERNIAMVFQSYALYPHKTVRENLAFGLRMRKVPPAGIDRAVARAASVLGLEPLLGRRPAELSGGQKQRVAFGRALVREPSVFLFDEPLSNLDAQLRADLRREIADLHGRLDTTMLYVTHDQVEAMTLGERIAVLHDGVLQQYAPPLEVYDRPANLFVASFIGTPAINAVGGTLTHDAEGARFTCPRLTVGLATGSDALARGQATLAVRPEAISLGPAATPPGGADTARPGFDTRVLRLEPLGNEVLVHIEGPAGAPWIARAAPREAPAAGDVVRATLDARRVHLFAADGRRVAG